MSDLEIEIIETLSQSATAMQAAANNLAPDAPSYVRELLTMARERAENVKGSLSHGEIK